MPQQRLKILCAVTKTQESQIHNFFFFLKKNDTSCKLTLLVSSNDLELTVCQALF